MQIHLSDCKSSDRLLSSLGTGKLNLCMLVLSNIRDTYWSASVMHRLFERAQSILAKSCVEGPAAATSESVSVQQQRSASVASPPTQKTRGEEARIASAQYPQATGSDNGLMPQLAQPPALSEVGHDLQQQSSSTGPVLWWDEAPCFTSVEPLLSPGFALSDETCQALFTGYDSFGAVPAVAYDPVVAVPSGSSMDLLYSDI